MEQEFGLIYGLTNPYFEGMVKIGATRSLDVSKRMRVLGTAVPVPFECAFAYKVPAGELFNIERTLHNALESCRFKGSEFFNIDAAVVDNLMRNIGRFEPMQTAVQEQIDSEEAKRSKKPTMDFFKMGLPAGTPLFYVKDASVRCVIISNRKVRFGGIETSLSAVTQQLLGYAAQPSPYWRTEDGVLLTSIYADYVKREADEAKKASEAAAMQAKELQSL